jgi:thymidine kinase
MLKLIIGPMKSGKSTRLLQEVERFKYAKKNCVIIRPAADSREYLTRSGKDIGIEIIKLNKNQTIENLNYDVIGIDELQFFTPKSFDNILKYRDTKIVICSALNATSEQTPWDIVYSIIPFVDDIVFLHAVCEECGDMKAAFSYFKGGKTDEIVIGDNEYQSLCWDCLQKKKNS